MAAAALLALGACGKAQPGDAPAATPSASSMSLTSTAFANGGAIPAELTCDGAGRSPPLQWSEPPPGTQGFALVVEDSDAPGGTFGHWGVYDLPMSARQLNAGVGESDAHVLSQTINDFGERGYGPPCPPKGDPPHHYHFRLLALDIERLPNPPADAKAISALTHGHELGRAELIGLYGRK